MLQWAWIDFENRRVAWPDSKTGGISKPMSETAHQLLSNAERIEDSPYVCPSIYDKDIPLSEGTYYNSWRRILQRAKVPPVGTHGIRHRAATDIANSGIPALNSLTAILKAMGLRLAVAPLDSAEPVHLV